MDTEHESDLQLERMERNLREGLGRLEAFTLSMARRRDCVQFEILSIGDLPPVADGPRDELSQARP